LLAAQEESKNAKTMNVKMKMNNFFITIFLRDELIQLIKGGIGALAYQKKKRK
jgi:hypothetical protein